MRTYRDKEMRYAREQSKRHNETWIVEEVIGGHGKGSISSHPSYDNCCWWKTSVVKVIATYKNGKLC